MSTSFKKYYLTCGDRVKSGREELFIDVANVRSVTREKKNLAPALLDGGRIYARMYDVTPRGVSATGNLASQRWFLSN